MVAGGRSATTERLGKEDDDAIGAAFHPEVDLSSDGLMADTCSVSSASKGEGESISREAEEEEEDEQEKSGKGWKTKY